MHAVSFFFPGQFSGTDKLIIKHISKYSNTMISFARTLCLHGCTSPHLASLANPSRWCLLKIQTLKVIHITGEFTIMRRLSAPNDSVSHPAWWHNLHPNWHWDPPPSHIGIRWGRQYGEWPSYTFHVLISQCSQLKKVSKGPIFLQFHVLVLFSLCFQVDLSSTLSLFKVGKPNCATIYVCPTIRTFSISPSIKDWLDILIISKQIFL